MGVSINIDSTVVNYPHNSPFHPDKIYPELENLDLQTYLIQKVKRHF